MNAQTSRIIDTDNATQPAPTQAPSVPLAPSVPSTTDPLWQKLVAFRFDPPEATYHFATRLASENGWTSEFTTRVLDEYRRFLFLAMRAGHPVSPSDPVDQAWHLHLLYTESYWGELCPHVLGQPFHHGPSKGGRAEETKFTDWYARTLESYAHYFGQSPPGEIWPPVAARFGTKPPRYQRVSLNDAWVIPKPRMPRRRAAFSFLGLAAIPFILAETDNDNNEAGFLVTMFFVLIALGVIVANAVDPRRRRGRKSGGDGGGGGSSCGSGSDSGSGHHGGHHGSHSGHDGGSGHGGHSCGGGHGCGGHGCGGHGCGGGCGGGH